MDITHILAQHALWLDDPLRGRQANLTAHNLRGKDLRKANLTGILLGHLVWP